MIKDHHYTCAHTGCACRVTPPSLYCSKDCEEEARKGDDQAAFPCTCGHPKCVSKQTQ